MNSKDHKQSFVEINLTPVKQKIWNALEEALNVGGWRVGPRAGEISLTYGKDCLSILEYEAVFKYNDNKFKIELNNKPLLTIREPCNKTKYDRLLKHVIHIYNLSKEKYEEIRIIKKIVSSRKYYE